jgi:hypothetical protein
MLTASLDIGDMIPKLNRYTQESLDKSLKFNIFQPCLKLSRNCKIFVWQCLQIPPEGRMEAREAACHGWLCTPEKHLKFFQELDRRILHSWKAPTEMRAMPLQLPSVVLQSLAPLRDQEALFKAYSNLSRHYPLLQTEFSNHFRASVLNNKSVEVVGEDKLSTKAKFEQLRAPDSKGSSTTLSSSNDPESLETHSSSPQEADDLQKHSPEMGNTKRKRADVVLRSAKAQSVRRRTTGP